MTWRDEEELIAGLFAPLASGLPGAYGLRDDAACFAPPPGEAVVLSTDAIVAGLHLPADADPADVAWKALAVNVSDVVAKGATPRAYLCAVLVGETHRDARGPGAVAAWLARFAEGLGRAQRHFAIDLAGGDTDRARPGIKAPAYHVAVTMIATLPADAFVTRGKARPGDDIVLTGPVGAAALGLRLDTADAQAAGWPLEPSASESLIEAYRRPRPIPALAAAVRTHARAAIDISDGLVKDVRRLCVTSGVGARIDAAAVPLPPAASPLVASARIERQLLLTGGEDYCVAAAVAPEETKAFMRAAERAGATPAVIGRILEPEQGFRVVDEEGRELTFAHAGYDHLAE